MTQEEHQLRQQQQQYQELLQKATAYKCACGCEHFQEVIVLKELGPIMSPTGRTEYLQGPVLLCFKCHTPFERKKLIGG